MSSRPQPFVARTHIPAFHFGPYALDLNRGVLLRGAEEIKLRPQSYEALKYLVVNGGRLIPKSELIGALWPDAIAVSDDSLMQCIRDVRRALGEAGHEFIRTVPGRGYIFEAPVRPEVPAKPVAAPPVSRRRMPVAWIALGVLSVAAMGWGWKTFSGRSDARASIPRLKQLAADGKYLEGYRLANDILRRLPNEPAVLALLPDLRDDFSVTTTPPGAVVTVRRFGSSQAEPLGTTPIRHALVARGDFIVSIQKAGFADFERTISSRIRRGAVQEKAWQIDLQVPLIETAKAHRGMVFVSPGEHSLWGYSRTGDASVKLNAYFIDKFEVSNREYKAFVDGGGYKQPGLAALKDKTGLNGPRNWVAGTFPEGKESHPVTGVSWPEAAGYCEAQRKMLPTLFQWERAARDRLHSAHGVVFPWGLLNPGDIAQRANFESSGTVPVDSFPFGMSPHGAYNMAGNVMEWVRNRYDDGYATAGGAWSDPQYQFGHYGRRPALESDATVGFRCALGDGDSGEMALTSKSSGYSFSYPVSSDAEFGRTKALYAYAKTPLNAEVLSVQETDQWRREEIAYDGLAERARAYLYLPNNAARPLQTIHLLSGDNWFLGIPVTDNVEGKAGHMAPYLRAGRAVFLVVLKGFAGRPPVGAYHRRDYGSAERINILKQWIVDMQRGLDYLDTRADIDHHKIAFWNNSTYPEGAVMAGLEPRYASTIFVGAGMSRTMQYVAPETNPLHFFPHIKQPKLVLHGLYDDGHPLAANEALYQLMREPKRRATFSGGHMPPPQIAVPLVQPYLDETLGPVKR